MKLSLSIAWRFLITSRGQTVLIALGIAIGIAVQVFIGSLITGLQQSLLDKTIGRSPHITVTGQTRSDRIGDWQSVVDTMKAQPGVTAVSPVADGSGFLKVGEETYPVLARGVDLGAADGIYRLSEALVSGALPEGDQVLIGKELADEAGLAPGSTVDLLTPQGKAVAVTIAGVFDLKVSSLNKSWAIAPMALVQDAFGYGDEITSVEAQVAQVFQADSLAQSLAPLLPSGLTVENWKAQNEQLLSGLNGQSVSSVMIQVFVLVSVVLGIASVLAISVLQKSRQIGILKAMGIQNGMASQIFLFQGLILGVLGAVLGVGLGLGLSSMFTRFAVNSDGTPVVPLLIDPVFIGVSGLIGVLSATMAALIPARRSARLDPMEVIKNG